MPLTPAWSCLTGTALVQSSHLLAIPSDHRRNSSALRISIHSTEGKKATEKARVVVERWNNILGESILGTLRAAWHRPRSGCFAALGVVGVILCITLKEPCMWVGRTPSFQVTPCSPERQEPGGRSLWDAFTMGHLRSYRTATVSTSSSEACGGVTATGVPSEQQQTGQLTRSHRQSHRGPWGRSPFARGWGRDGLGRGQALACSVGCGKRRCTTEFIFYIFRGCCKAAAEPAGCRAPVPVGPRLWRALPL